VRNHSFDRSLGIQIGNQALIVAARAALYAALVQAGAAPLPGAPSAVPRRNTATLIPMANRMLRNNEHDKRF
jgi:hypothetical protein